MSRDEKATFEEALENLRGAAYRVGAVCYVMLGKKAKRENGAARLARGHAERARPGREG